MTVAATLRQLHKKLDDRGRVLDPVLARRIVCCRAGTEREGARVVFRPPVATKDLDALNALCREAFGSPIPAALSTLYKATDGLWANTYEPGERLSSSTRDVSYEGGIRPVKQIIKALKEVLVETEDPDGQIRHHMLAVLPFADIPDQGWVGFDPLRLAPTGIPKVVTYDFEEVDPSASPKKISKACTLVAKSFEDWFERYVDSGLNVLLGIEEEYQDEYVPPPPPPPDSPTPTPRVFAGTVHDARVLFVSPHMVLVTVEGLPFNPKFDETAAVKRGDHVRIGLEGREVRYVERTRPDGEVERWNRRY